MRIGLDTGIAALPDAQQPSKSGSAAAASGNSDPSAGNAKFSWDESRVRSLSTAVAELPEIRQERVAALAESVRNGTYAVTAGQTAEALITHARRAA